MNVVILSVSLAVIGIQDGYGQDSLYQNIGYVIYNKISGYNLPFTNEQKHLIKLNPLLIINGDIPVYYERRLKENWAVEGSAGITLKDYLHDLFYFDPNMPSDVNVVPERKFKPGYSFSFSPRFYPSGIFEESEIFYFAPELRYRKYRSQALKGESFNSSFQEDFVDEYRQLIDIKLSFGYITYLDDHVFIEWYGGIGIRAKRQRQAVVLEDSYP
jgi:site-specific DNA-adenine methylase